MLSFRTRAARSGIGFRFIARWRFQRGKRCYTLRNSAPIPPMQLYLDLLRDVLEHGSHKDDRTGTGTRSVFGRQIRMVHAAALPLLPSK